MSDGRDTSEHLEYATHAFRNLRLPDPPKEHLGQRFTDFRFATLADLAIMYLSQRVLQTAITEFGSSTS